MLGVEGGLAAATKNEWGGQPGKASFSRKWFPTLITQLSPGCRDRRKSVLGGGNSRGKALWQEGLWPPCEPKVGACGQSPEGQRGWQDRAWKEFGWNDLS